MVLDHDQLMHRTADVATAVAPVALGYSWLVAATQIAQFIAAVIAIVSGSFAIYYYWKKSK